MHPPVSTPATLTPASALALLRAFAPPVGVTDSTPVPAGGWANVAAAADALADAFPGATVPCAVCAAPVPLARAATLTPGAPVCLPSAPTAWGERSAVPCERVGRGLPARSGDWDGWTADGDVRGLPWLASYRHGAVLSHPAPAPRPARVTVAPPKGADGPAVTVGAAALRPPRTGPVTVAVTFDGDPWPLAAWRQDDESADAALVALAARQAAAGHPSPLALRAGSVMGGGADAGQGATGPLTFTTDDGATVTVPDFPLSLDLGAGRVTTGERGRQYRGTFVDHGRRQAPRQDGERAADYAARVALAGRVTATAFGTGVRPNVTPRLIAAGLARPGGKSGPVVWSAPGAWALVPGEFPALVDPAAPGVTRGTVNAGGGRRMGAAGRVPASRQSRTRKGVPMGDGAPIGAGALAAACAAHPALADVLRAVPVPARTGDAAADRMAGQSYRRALKRATR
jgi:hypothetical protein